MYLEEILVLQPGPLSSVEPSAPFPPASSDSARHPNSAPPSAPTPDYAASRAVLARQNETNLQLSKEQLDFLHLVEMNEVSATITEICEFGGVSRPTFYRWRSNPRFAQAFGECIARCVFNDLSIVLRNELQDAMTGDRKAGRHTLKLFLSGRGLQHYDAILSMLNSAGRNTPIPPHAGQSDPNSPASAPSQANPSSAAPPAVIVAPSAGSAPPRAATAAAPSAPPATAFAVTAAAPASYSAPRATIAPAPAASSPAAAPSTHAAEEIPTVVTAPAPQSPEPITTTAAPFTSAPVEIVPLVASPIPAAVSRGMSAPAASPAMSTSAATPAMSAFEAAWAMTLDAIDATEGHRFAPNPAANETFSSPEESRPELGQPLPSQRVSNSADSEIAFSVSHAFAAAGHDSRAPREPRRSAPQLSPPIAATAALHSAAVEHAPVVASLAPAAAGPAISAFAAAYAKGLGASGADSHDLSLDSPENETFSSPKILKTQNLQLTRNTSLTATIAPSAGPKCRIACLTSSALRRARRPALRKSGGAGENQKAPASSRNQWGMATHKIRGAGRLPVRSDVHQAASHSWSTSWSTRTKGTKTRVALSIREWIGRDRPT
jgi:hypothetical protein